jgi:mono/diheme cytochrome c family protein
VFLLVTTVAAVLAACGSSSRSGGSGSHAVGSPSTSGSSTASGSATASTASTTGGSHGQSTTSASSPAAGHASTAEGLQVFTSAGCGGCHTLAAAHATGQVGPNLNDLHPSEALVAAQVTNGGAAMPSFAGRLSKSQIEAVARFVASAAG